MSRALPEGWVEGFDQNYGRPYYFHKPTRRSSWTRPDAVVDDAASEEGSAATASFRRSQFSNSFHGSIGSPATSFIGGQQQHAVTRFNDWLEVYSPEHDRTFFFNKVTRESQWIDPRDHSNHVGNGSVNHSGQQSKVTMVKNEETPAAFLSIWESVGSDSQRQQPQDRLKTTPISQDGRKSLGASPLISAPLHSPSKATLAASPIKSSIAAQPVANSAVPFQQSFDERHAAHHATVRASSRSVGSDARSISSRNMQNDNPLADELENYARDLERQNDLINHHAQMLDPRDREEASQLKEDVNELTETAEAVLRSAKGSSKARRGVKRLLNEEGALSIWGTEPPKVLDVKRVMQDVKSGVKYVREELKAQGAANAEAEKIDSEGGYYTILGVPTNADMETMKKAYRKAMIKCHPDKVPADERTKALEKSNMLQNAYNCLSDPWERYLYDYFGLKRYLQNAKVIQCFKNYMLSGIEIIKHPRKGYPRKRLFWISPDFEWLLTGRERILEPTAEQREQMKGVRIKDIHEITRGITTEVFERTGKPKKQSRYFSIITAERTLDLEAESKERADFYISRISLLVLDTQKNKKWLQRHFELKALREAADAALRAAHGFGPKPTPPEGPSPSEQNRNSGTPEPPV